MLKLVIGFQQGRASPTESHYFVSAATFSTAIPQAVALLNLRAALLGGAAYITSAVIHDIANPRDVQLLDPSLYTFQGPYPVETEQPTAALENSDQPNSAVLVRINTNALPKNLYLSLIPDDIIGTRFSNPPNVDFSANPAWIAAFTAWWGGPNPSSASLCGGRWGNLQKTPTNKQVAVPIVPAAPWAAYAALQLGGALAGVTGSKILVKGFRRINPRLPGLSGVYKILQVLSGNTYVLANTQAAQVANVQPEPGQAYDLAYTVTPYISATIVKGTTRKRGGSYGAPRGRSRTRA